MDENKWNFSILVAVLIFLVIGIFLMVGPLNRLNSANAPKSQFDSTQYYREAYQFEKSITDTIFDRYYLVNKKDFKIQKIINPTNK